MAGAKTPATEAGVRWQNRVIRTQRVLSSLGLLRTGVVSCLGTGNMVQRTSADRAIVIRIVVVMWLRPFLCLIDSR